MRAAAVLCALLGCTTEGMVLESSADSGAGGADADPGAPDADTCPEVGPCPDPPAGDITVCGRVLDLELSAPVTTGAPPVRIYDFVDLRLNPNGASALATVTPDSCGWYTATVDGLAGVFVVHTGALPPDTGVHRRVVEVFSSAPGQTVRANAWTLRADTDTGWSAAAGLGAQTFADRGSLLAIYVDIDQPAVPPLQGAPVTGVELTVNGIPNAADDYYFSDAMPLARFDLAPGQADTGANGTGLLADGPTFSQLSGDKGGCNFAEVNTLPIANTVQVQEIAGSCN